MFKRHISKRTIATVATVLVAAITTQWLLIPQIQWNSRVSAADAWDPNNLDTVSHVNYSSVLGRGVDYGIIANHIIQTSHMETTFATNLFTSDNSRSCDVDFQDPNVIAHFMIGGFDSNTVDGGNGPSSLALDKTTASTLVFQAPEHIFTDSQSDRSEGRSFNQAYPRGGYNGPYFDLRGNFHSSIISDPDDSVGTEINNLIDRVSGVGGQSETLVSHTGYAALPYTYTDENNVVHNYIVLDDTNKTVTININEECFDDKVVYIDVDKTMLEYMTAGDTHLTINKRPSTVVVFNITDEVVNEAISDGTLQLQQYRVNCTYNGTYYSMKTETPCMGDREGAPGGANAAIMDELLCQRFIWNITTNNDVTLGPIAGAILLPNSKNIDFADPPCGWIVTGENGTVNVNKEFHYLYNSSSGNIFGQMNFSMEKRFTQTYADKDSVIEESFSFNDGDFQFIWQEYNNIDFADSHKVGSAVSVDAIDQGFTQFAPLQFYSDPAFSSEAHYVPQGEFRDFYYKISENPNKIVSGVSNSDGYVLIRLRVFNDEGNLKFYVQSDAYTGEGANLIPYHQNGSFGSDVWNPNDPSNANYWIQVRGNYNFSLGGFYNRLESNVLTITKTISIPDGFNLSSVGSIEFTIDPAINGVSSVELNPSSPSAGWLVSGNTFTYKFDNVPNGSYRITESAGSCSDGLVLDTSSSNITEKTPTVDDNHNGNAIFVNSYRDSSYGSISLGKIVDGLGTDSLRPDQSFEFWVYYLDSNGNKVYLTYNNGVTSTSPGSWDQIIYIKPGQTITLTGSAVPADKVFYIEEISSAALINNGQQIDPWRFVNQGTHTCTSTSIAQTDSSGSTSVTGRSTSVDLSTTGTASCIFTNIYDGGSTPTGAEITISKQNRNGDSLSGATLQLTGSNASGDISFADVTVTGADDVSRDGNALTFKTNGSNVVVSNLPDGTYTLDELTAPGGYDEAADITFTITNGTVDNMTNNTVVMVDEQSGSTLGSLTITKKLRGVTTADVTSDLTYYVVLQRTDSSNTTTYYTNNASNRWSANQSAAYVMPITVRSGGLSGSITIADLETTGYTYVVTETKADGTAISATTDVPAISGFTFDPTGSHTTSTSFSSGETTATAEITNKYDSDTPTLGNLCLTKVLTGVDSSVDTSNLEYYVILYRERTGSPAEYYAVDGTWGDRSNAATIRIKVGDSNIVTIADVDTSYQYVAQETDSNGQAIDESNVQVISGYAWVSVESVTGGWTSDSTPTATITVTNTYSATTPTTGYLQVTKILTLTDGTTAINAPEGTTFTFNVFQGSATTGIPYRTIPVTVPRGSSTATSTPIEVPQGDYTIVEATQGSMTGYTYSGVTPASAAVTVGSGNTTTETAANATFTNTYTVQQTTTSGTLKIKKALSGVDSSVSTSGLSYYVILGRRAPGSTDVEYYNTSGGWGALTDAQVITIRVGQETSIDNLDTSYAYFVTETDSNGNAVGNTYKPAEISGYDWTSVSYSSIVWSTGSTPEATVTVTNNYSATTPTTGYLQVTKILTLTDGTTAINAPEGTTFTFNVFQGSATTGIPYRTIPVTVPRGSSTATSTPIEVPQGNYTIVEATQGSMTGYTYSGVTPASAAVTVGSGNTTTETAAGATFTNTYTAASTLGALVVTKTVTGDTSITGPFSFTVQNAAGEYLQAQDTGVFDSASVTFRVVAGGSVSFSNIPDGTVCTVTETDADTFGRLDTGSTTSGSATIVAGSSVSVDLTNAYATPTPTTPTPTDTVTPTPTDSVTPTPTGTDETTPVPTSSEETTPTETTPTESDSQETQPAGPATGAIIISKTISGAPLNELETITFVLTDTACGATREVPALTMENVANGLWGDAGNGTYYCIIDGLSAGVTYTIVESLDGHTSTYSLDAASSVTSASVAVVANDTVGVTLTDAYTTGGTTESSETVPTESSTDATESSNATEGTTETAPDVESVTLSGAVINSNYYTVNSDGTITLTDAGRRALGSGSFTFTITYVNGATRTQTIIVDSADRVPTTGEGSVNSIAAIILLTSAAFVFAAKKLREEEQ